jgi:hypothetical protein
MTDEKTVRPMNETQVELKLAGKSYFWLEGEINA